jgi:hypothetical protein
MYVAKLRAGRGLRIGVAELTVRGATSGTVEFEIRTPTPLQADARIEQGDGCLLLLAICRSGSSLRLGEALVHVRHARRGEAKLAIDADRRVEIDLLHSNDRPQRTR